MRLVSSLRFSAFAVVGGIVVSALASALPDAPSPASFVQNGEAGFVVSDIGYALSEDAPETGACPNGMTLGGNRLREAVAAGQVPAPDPGTGAHYIINMTFGAAAQRAAGQGGAQAQAPSQGGGAPARAASSELGVNPCSNPEQFAPDPFFKTVEADVPAYGIDLDGRDTQTGPRRTPTSGNLSDFRGFNGERGIDNQLFRAVGCSPSFQSTGSSIPFAIEMLTGAWGIVIRLRGVDDIRNDDHVQVEIAANADPIQLSPSREPIPYATYSMWPDARFRATTQGRIRNGVLTSDPVDVRFWKITNSFWLERPLRDARLQATVSQDGVIDGYLAGYTPVEDMFNFQYAYRNAFTGPDGTPAPRAVRSALGGNFTVGHSCNGAYYALYANADGHPDENGRFTSISTQYRIRAIPAFVMDATPAVAN